MGERISVEHLRSVCCPGQGADACSYIIATLAGINCAKGTELEAVLTDRRLAKTMIALGDNCPGWSVVSAEVV